MTIDNESPAGAWANELKAAPWGYGQERDQRVESALASIRMRGLWSEASILAAEISRSKVQCHQCRSQTSGQTDQSD